MRSWSVLLAFSFMAGEAQGVLLRETGMLMTHDSATGYIGVRDIMKDFAMTQTVSLVDQLNCGARALDLRLAQTAFNPLEIFGTRRRKISYHHGKMPAWVSDQTLDSTLGGLVKWAKAHPDELVLLLTSHTYHSNSVGELSGDGHMTHDGKLMRDIKRVFVEHFGIRWAFDCNALNTWTYEEAKEAALMDGGGRMLVVDGDCVRSMYDPTVKKQSLVEPYVKYAMSVKGTQPRMFTVQSLIQQSGSLHVPLSADLNRDVLSWVENGIYKGVNLLEVNTVCAYGPDISLKLGATVSPSDLNTCRAACQRGCYKYSRLPHCQFLTELALPSNSSASLLV